MQKLLLRQFLAGVSVRVRISKKCYTYLRFHSISAFCQLYISRPDITVRVYVSRPRCQVSPSRLSETDEKSSGLCSLVLPKSLCGESLLFVSSVGYSMLRHKVKKGRYLQRKAKEFRGWRGSGISVKAKSEVGR